MTAACWPTRCGGRCRTATGSTTARASPTRRRFTTPRNGRALAELGLFYAFADEDAGGMGGSGFDIAVVFEELGRVLCPEPVLPALMAIPRLRGHGGACRRRYCQGPSGTPWPSAKPTRHMTSKGSPRGPRNPGTAGRCRGRKTVVYGAGAADRLLVLAVAEDGAGLFDVAASDAGNRRLWHDRRRPGGGRSRWMARPRDTAGGRPAGHARLGGSGALGRGARGDGCNLRDADRVSRHAQAVRPAHRCLPGASAPCRRPVDRDRAGAVHHHRRRRRDGRAGPVAPREPGQASGGPHRKGRGGGSDPDAWRHRDDVGVSGQPLRQAAGHDRPPSSEIPTTISSG